MNVVCQQTMNFNWITFHLGLVMIYKWTFNPFIDLFIVETILLHAVFVDTWCDSINIGIKWKQRKLWITRQFILVLFVCVNQVKSSCVYWLMQGK